MPINPMFMQMEPAQRAGMAPRQEELERWLREVESSDDTQGNRGPVGHLLGWMGERLAEYSSRLASAARRKRSEPPAQQKCRETDDPVRQPRVAGIWINGHGRSEPYGTI
jgi:hypothetical protein